MPKRCLKPWRLPHTSSLPGHCWRGLTTLLPPVDDRFSARRGTYRVIYRGDDKTHVVTVAGIGAGRMFESAGRTSSRSRSTT